MDEDFDKEERDAAAFAAFVAVVGFAVIGSLTFICTVAVLLAVRLVF